MAIERFSAIVMQAYETGETSEVLHVFCGAFGRLSVMAKGLRNPKNRLRGLLQPLASVELTVFLKESAEMATLKEAAPVRDRDVLRGDLERLSLGSLLVEIAASCCESHQQSLEMFAVVEAGLDVLDLARSAQPPSTAALHHLLRILAIAGYEPTIDPALLRSWTGGIKPLMFWLDIGEGRVHANRPQPVEIAWPLLPDSRDAQFPLPPEAVRALYENQRADIEDFGALPSLEAAHARQFIEGLVRLIQWHLDRPIRSARFWRSMARMESTGRSI